MTARGHLRGHPIEWDEANQCWCYSDTGGATEDEWRARPCGHCGQHDTPEGHDACLGTLPGVMNACCGHGLDSEAYLQFPDGSTVRGATAIALMGVAGRCVPPPPPPPPPRDVRGSHPWGDDKPLVVLIVVAAIFLGVVLGVIHG